VTVTVSSRPIVVNGVTPSRLIGAIASRRMNDDMVVVCGALLRRARSMGSAIPIAIA